MAGLHGNADDQPWHVVLTTADAVEINLIAVGEDNKPVEFEGALTPVDATESFRPGGVPREFSKFDAGAGYTQFDERVPNGYDYGINVWTMGPSPLPSGELTEITLPSGTHGEIRTAIQTAGAIYLSTGRYAIKLSGANTTATLAADFTTIASMSTAVTITSSCLFLGKAYWAGYAGATAQPLVQHVLSSDTFTSGATCTRWHVASFNGVDGEGNWAQWMIGTVATNAAFKYTNSATALADTNWSPGSADGTAVGDPSIPVNQIVCARQAPYFIKPEGVFIVQRFGVAIPNITPHWADTYHANNGVGAAVIAGRLYANILSGLDMVIGLDGQVNETPFLVHPGADLPTEMPAAGDGWAVCRDGDAVVYAVYNSATTTSYICWGKPRSSVPGQPGLTNFVWHVSPCVIEGERVTWMRKIAPSGVPYLLIATRNAADTQTKLYRLSLPRNGNVLQELAAGGPWRCRTDTCTLYLSRYPGVQGAHSLKSLRQVATVAKNASESSYLTVYVDPDEEGREQLGAPVTETYTEARILDDVNGRQLAPSVDFKAGTSTTPPILRSVTYWTAEGVKATTTYRGRFRFAEGVKLRGQRGTERDWDPQAQWELLISAQGPRPATMTDWKGTIYTVAIEQGAAWKEREIASGARYEIDFSMQFTVLARETGYDDGAVYDSATEYTA